MPHLEGEISPRDRETQGEKREVFVEFLENKKSIIPEDLKALEEKALLDWMPIIRKDTQALLIWLMKERRPKRILEIGTCVGFSSILMARYTEDDTQIFTVENYEPRIKEATENIEKFGYGNRITLMPMDAKEALYELDGQFDFIFLDGPKGQYPFYLPRLLELLSQDGMLVTDNVLFDGDLLKQRSEIRHRDRTIHDRLNMFLDELLNNESLNTLVTQTGDGMALTTRIK